MNSLAFRVVFQLLPLPQGSKSNLMVRSKLSCLYRSSLSSNLGNIVLFDQFYSNIITTQTCFNATLSRGCRHQRALLRDWRPQHLANGGAASLNKVNLLMVVGISRNEVDGNEISFLIPLDVHLRATSLACFQSTLCIFNSNLFAWHMLLDAKPFPRTPGNPTPILEHLKICYLLTLFKVGTCQDLIFWKGLP